MAKVYSYLRFSDPKQAGGSSVDRQLAYAARWALEHGHVLDAELSMRDEGLSAYHERHVSQGALGVFLRAVEDGKIGPGSVLIVEGLDRLSRAEPLKAQAQLTQIIHAGLTVVTAADGQEYSLDAVKANPYKLIHSLVVMIRAHEESDTKSKRVRAAIRRQCERWLDGSWRGIIRNGRDPQWLRQVGQAWEVIPERAAAVRYVVDRYMAGQGSIRILREMAERGLQISDKGLTNSAYLIQLMRKRILVGEREFEVAGEIYRLPGYYPAILSEEEWQALQRVANRRQGSRGVGEIPGLFTGLGITVCGYCGRYVFSSNLMGRKRQADGRPHPGHRRLLCYGYSQGTAGPCRSGIQAGAVETAIMLYCADPLRLDGLMAGGDRITELRARLAAARARVAEVEARLSRLAAALALDDGPTPLTLVRSMRGLEADADRDRAEIAALERELGAWRPPAAPDLAERWRGLIEGVAALDTEARLAARTLIRESFSRIVLWHRGDPDGVDGGEVADLELHALGGGIQRLRIDRKTGALIESD